MNDEKVHSLFILLTTILAGALLVVLGLSVESILSPFVLVAALVYVLYPFRENVLARRSIVVALTLFGVWFIYSLLGVLFPFLAAFLLAYVFNPLVVKLEKKRVARWAGSLIITLGGLAAVGVVVLFVLPVALVQFQGLINAVGGLAQSVVEVMRSGRIFDLLAEWGLPAEEARRILTEELSPKLQGILTELFKAVLGFLTGFSSLILQIINAIIIPFLFFYILKDLPLIKETFAALLPDSVRTRTLVLINSIDEVLGRYLRGALIVALIQGTLSAVVLTLIGVNYSLVLGVMTAVLNFIPYVGLITSLVVASIVALFSGGAVGAKVIGVIVLYLSQKLLEATVLAPKIIGSKVGLHPVVLILCLVVFGYFLGFVGMLIAVPTTALLIALLRDWRRVRQEPLRETPIEV
jgi:predicted PurR-regulated permease PerM